MNTSIRSAARVVKRLALGTLERVGGFRAIAVSTWRQQRLLILCYHGVSLQDEHEWDPELFVTPEFLRKRFSVIRDMDCTVLPLGEGIERLQRHSLPPRSVVLTFDDGFYNFLAAAVPLLEEFGYPSTNYVSSYHSMHQRPLLMLTLRYLLWKAMPRQFDPETLPGVSNAVNLDDPDTARSVYETLLNYCRSYSHDRAQQQDVLRDLARRLNVDWERIVRQRLFHLMTGDELVTTAGRGVDIQLHTHHHRTPRIQSEFYNEVMTNRNYLEPLSGSPTRHFCYPSGDVDMMFLPWLAESGVESATTGRPGLATRDDHPLLLPRYIDTMAQTETVYKSWLSGASELFRARRR